MFSTANTFPLCITILNNGDERWWREFLRWKTSPNVFWIRGSRKIVWIPISRDLDLQLLSKFDTRILKNDTRSADAGFYLQVCLKHINISDQRQVTGDGDRVFPQTRRAEDPRGSEDVHRESRRDWWSGSGRHLGNVRKSDWALFLKSSIYFSLLLAVVSGAAAQDRMDRTVLAPWLRFLWDSYRNCLELLRNNAQARNLTFF